MLYFCYPTITRRLKIVDSDDHALFISLGCALENLIIAASYMGYGAKVEYFPTDEEECIKVSLIKKKVEFDHDLFKAITTRQTTRSKFTGGRIPFEDFKKLEQASKQDMVSLIIFKEEKEIEPILEFVKEANILQFKNKLFVSELIDWIRFNKNEEHSQALMD